MIVWIFTLVVYLAAGGSMQLHAGVFSTQQECETYREKLVIMPDTAPYGYSTLPCLSLQR